MGDDVTGANNCLCNPVASRRRTESQRVPLWLNDGLLSVVCDADHSVQLTFILDAPTRSADRETRILVAENDWGWVSCVITVTSEQRNL
jgi:hypothetical protein